jgi:hypothetical protein
MAYSTDPVVATPTAPIVARSPLASWQSSCAPPARLTSPASRGGRKMRKERDLGIVHALGRRQRLVIARSGQAVFAIQWL